MGFGRAALRQALVPAQLRARLFEAGAGGKLRRTGTGNGGLQMLYLLIGNRAPCKQGFAALQVGAQTRQLSFSLGQFGLTAFDA